MHGKKAVRVSFGKRLMCHRSSKVASNQADIVNQDTRSSAALR
jgi:hypothetical protein